MVSKNPKGRPSSYRPEYCQRIIDYFNVDPFETVKDEEGKDTDIYCHKFPSFERFAQDIGVSVNTIKTWAKNNADFLIAMEKAKRLQVAFLSESALYGLVNSPFAIFMSKNVFGWSDQGPKAYTKVNFSRCKTPKEKTEKIIREAVNGNITLEQARLLTDQIKSLVFVTEATELQKRVDDMERAFNERRSGKES